MWRTDIDHVLELSQGGDNSDRNLRTLCCRCHVLQAGQFYQGVFARALRD